MFLIFYFNLLAAHGTSIYSKRKNEEKKFVQNEQNKVTLVIFTRLIHKSSTRTLRIEIFFFFGTDRAVSQNG